MLDSVSDSYIKDPPLKNDENAKLEEPFTFSEWIDQHKEELSNGKKLSMFPHEFQTRVYVMSKGHHSVDCCDGDVWLWQHVSSYCLIRKLRCFSFFCFGVNRTDIQQLK